MPRYKVKRRNTQEAKEMQEFARQFKAKRVGAQVTFQSSSEKMSEVLEEFLAPYTHIPKAFDEYNRLVAVGIMAWNAAIIPSAERQQLLDKAIEALPASSGHEARQDLKQSWMSLSSARSAILVVTSDSFLIIAYLIQRPVIICPSFQRHRDRRTGEFT